MIFKICLISKILYRGNLIIGTIIYKVYLLIKKLASR